MSHQQIWTDPTTSEKKGTRHNSQHTDWPIHGSVPSFSHKPTNEAVSLSQASVKDKLLGLLDPYHQHAIGTFKTCSRGPTYRSLTNTGGGYNLGGTSFPHTTPRPSQPAVSTFHLRAPPGSSLIINQQVNQSFKFKEPMAATWSFNHSAIYRDL
jgi:hypothetical protein